MKNKLTDLNDHLFAQLDRLGDKDISGENLDREVSRTDAIIKVSEQVINSASIALKAAELVAKHGVGKWENMLISIDNVPTPENSGQKLPNYSDEK